MSMLTIYAEGGQGEPEKYVQGEEIAAQLSPLGIRFERWQAGRQLDAEASNDEILEAYREPVDRLMQEYGFQSVDVVSLHPEHPQKLALREKFLQEHTHSDFEVRFFIDGQGLFYIHHGGKVYAVLCEKGDLISVPANTPHWFDMGAQPTFKCIRLFTSADGWEANYTGDTIATRFPLLDNQDGAVINAVVTDIEGTTSSISYVSNTLFPYAREHMADFILAHGESDEIVRLMDEVRAIAGESLDEEGVIEQLVHWIDADEKATPLKTIQGMIWEEGYRRGDFAGHVYEDAVQYLKQWHKKGVKLYVYSSGSVQAQEMLFTHSDHGDLSLLFSGYFDTHIGAKREAASYAEIVRQLGLPAGEILFLSDIKQELDAARMAGMQVCWVVRSDKDGDDAGYIRAENFNQVDERFFAGS